MCVCVCVCACATIKDNQQCKDVVCQNREIERKRIERETYSVQPSSLRSTLPLLSLAP